MVVDRPVLIPIDHTVWCLLVFISLLREAAVQRECRRSALRIGCAIDAERAVEERDLPTPEVEALCQGGIGHIRAVLREQDVQSCET